MPSPPFTLVTPPGFQRYDCVGCGACCRGRFAIGVTVEERKRIVAQGWDSDPALAGKTLFLPHGDRYVTAYDEHGACVFLDERGLCRIHAKYGEPAKPLACRLYPFRFIPQGNKVHADIRYDCAEVACNRGRALPEHAPAMRELLALALPAEAAALPPPPLFGRVQLGWGYLTRIVDAVDGLLCAESLDLTRRITGCINLAALLRNPRLTELDEPDFAELLRKVSTKVLDGARTDALARKAPPGMARVAFRQLLGVYARADHRGRPPSLLHRINVSLRMLAGRGLVPATRPDLPAVPFSTLEASFGLPDGDAAEPLLRCLRMRLLSLGFFGVGFYGRDVLDGLDALLFTYPLQLWFARLFAAGDGRTSLTRADTERAIELVDHQHGVSPILNLPTERTRLRFLCERTMLRALVVWYGA
jgi:lysine-N-methylase